ncbi:MAG: hypothetical protein ABW043_20510 [Devosia sp.]|uniref:hypothetical protein n=1 Tax=Devosia sp. TaxID=1871048 RepID=UPI003394457B
MLGYVRVSPDQIPLGETALLLFVHKGELCAGVLKHRCDGRMERLVPEDPSPNDLILGICRLMADMPDNSNLLVVLEALAYWPEPFPTLREFSASK